MPLSSWEMILWKTNVILQTALHIYNTHLSQSIFDRINSFFLFSIKRKKYSRNNIIKTICYLEHYINISLWKCCSKSLKESFNKCDRFDVFKYTYALTISNEMNLHKTERNLHRIWNWKNHSFAVFLFCFHWNWLRPTKYAAEGC